MTVREAKRILKAESKTGDLSQRQIRSGLAKLQIKHRVALASSDTSTVAQHREDFDIRNPVGHAAGYLAAIEDDDGVQVEPYLRFNYDATGVGVRLSNPLDSKTLHPMDSNQKAASVSKKKKLTTNMEMVRCCLMTYKYK